MEGKLLQENALKATKKRAHILHTLQEAGRPLRAEEVYQAVAAAFPVNLSTIYRALNAMCEKGLVEKTVRQDGMTYFTSRQTGHCHRLICTQCHAEIPVEHCPLEELEESLAEKTGFTITGHSLEFSGICPSCAAGKTQNKIEHKEAN